MRIIKVIVLIAVVAILAAAVVVYGGMVDVAADTPHGVAITRLLTIARERSIARRSADIAAPANLADPAVIAGGAGEYAEMCTGCHLAPGMEETEMRAGLNPRPPNFAQRGTARSAAQQFWIVKHGIKMTGMPAWGATHDDARLWSMVAFLQKLPGMSASAYQGLVASGAGGHHHEHADEHEHSDDHGAASTKTTLPHAAHEAAEVIDEFQEKLEHGDAQGAAALLNADVLVFEHGGAERSRDQYASHHLPADAAFLKGAEVRQISRTGNANGDLAWIATESEIRTRGANPASLVSTETMVLEHTTDGWRVAHIHWSSKPAN